MAWEAEQQLILWLKNNIRSKSNFNIKLARLLYTTALIKMPYSIPEYPYNRMSHHITMTY